MRLESNFRKRTFIKITAFLISLCLTVTLLTAYTHPIVCDGAQVQTVSVNAQNIDAAALQIDTLLMQEKSVTLKVKGKQTASAKLIAKLQRKIKKTNGQGVIFHYSFVKTKGKRTTYSISSAQASLYKYSVKFIKKLYTTERAKYTNDATALIAQDYYAYPKETTRMLRTAYDMISIWLDYNYNDSLIGQYADEDMTVIIENQSIKTNAATLARSNRKTYKSLLKKIDLSVIIKKITVSDDNTVFVTLKSFREFKKIKKVKSLFTNKSFWYETYYSTIDNKKSAKKSNLSDPNAHTLMLTNQTSILVAQSDFYRLSNAMKIWAIADSGYFACNTTRPAYGMLYRLHKGTYDMGAKGMKYLYRNKATGKCIHYASYEELTFKQLGIYVDKCAYFNHAWTVVRVKNSDGKVLWIPFDYGIGPSTKLAVSSSVKNKYLKTEAMRYRTYLCMTKGAPTYKNFKTSDFK
ncbi:hypothetical protein [Eubacterium oxidoreducens]|uniref:Uncharacterized protein n=1 Tax=Eubacterium oxidoreducens TaxID=1732 RepID=A0A1G6BMM3_EUBOX|nr:hypothetical protein [Eubacterium oxidoreducens]SDB21890.1 hypothetical protein SAMN02910417_01644 [Eubacterium oxidoreducens]